jgi:ABC-type transport system involved in multi-copper enzyme maturation permease subunit
MTNAFALTSLRLKLLLRQKIGWLSALVGVLILFIALIMGNVSYVNPAKLFWDFALGVSFVAQNVLGVYLAVSLFEQEKTKKTLHLMLASGVSRFDWLVGNFLGLFLGLVLIDLFWFVFTWMMGAVSYEWSPGVLAIQLKMTQWGALAIVLSMSFLFSHLLRGLIALLLGYSVWLYLNATSSVERVFLDQTRAYLTDSTWALKIVEFTKFLPRLEWYDWKVFVGYAEGPGWEKLFLLLLMALAWTFFFLVATHEKFKRSDL